MERIVDGQRALCVFWSVEHAKRDMRENGFPEEEGWQVIERDHEQLRQVFDLLGQGQGQGPELVSLEPAPGDPDLGGVFEPTVFVGMLEENLRTDEAAGGEEKGCE